MSDSSVVFRHYGISPWEIEVIYDTLRRTFQVSDEETSAEDPDYVSMIELGFPTKYSERFFTLFSMDSWFKIKGVLKDVKRRRGGKGLRALLRFTGFADNEALIYFPLIAKRDRTFEMGIEKIEYLVDIIPHQLKRLPDKTEEVWYSFDESAFKWYPGVAKAGGKNYFFKNEEWKAR